MRQLTITPTVVVVDVRPRTPVARVVADRG